MLNRFHKGVYSMKQFINGFLCMALLGSAAYAKVLPYIWTRSQSENAARELVLWQTQINKSCMDEFYGSFSITPEYTRTFQGWKITRMLFNDALHESSCNQDCLTFNVQGSAVPNRDPQSWLADNFGLPLDYASVVKISPRIENILADFNLYLGLDNWVQGLYFRVHAPLVNTRWRLGFCENIINVGEMNAPTGYYNGTVIETDSEVYGVPRSDLTGSFEGFISRCEIPEISGITFDPLSHARFGKHVLKRTKLSDVQFALGWNFWQSECYHFGLNIRGAAPTGSRPRGNYLFEPIVGNGHHWEYGAGLTGHWMLWRSRDENEEFNVYLDANITHLCRDRQCRTFDLCGKPLSRYMLASKMTSDVVNLLGNARSPLAPEYVIPSYQFDNEFSSVANLSTIKVNSSATVQADVALKFAYSHNCFQFDLGYEFWGRTCEKICPTECESFCTTKCCQTPEHEYWALKGNSFVYGFVLGTRQSHVSEAVALSSSENSAQLFCGTNPYSSSDDSTFVSNSNIDNVVEAFSGNQTRLFNFANGLADAPVYIATSLNPYVFDTADTKQWDFENAQARGISNKLFGDIGYIWNSRDHWCVEWTPYLGVGGEVEFGIIDKRSCNEPKITCPTLAASASSIGTRGCSCYSRPSNTSNNTTKCFKEEKCHCRNGAISQWGVWVKGGISFN